MISTEIIVQANPPLKLNFQAAIKIGSRNRERVNARRVIPKCCSKASQLKAGISGA
jgi:hypothetical protein